MVAGQDHLQGDEAVEPDLAGLVDDAHAAAAQLAEDLVAGDLGEGLGTRAGPICAILPAPTSTIVARATCSGSSARYRENAEVFVERGIGLATPAQPVLGGDQPENGGAVADQFRIADQVLFDPGGFPDLRRSSSSVCTSSMSRARRIWWPDGK